MSGGGAGEGQATGQEKHPRAAGMRWFSSSPALASPVWWACSARPGPSTEHLLTRVSVGAGDSRSCLLRVSLVAGDRLVKEPAQRPAHTQRGAGSRDGIITLGPHNSARLPARAQVRLQPWDSQVHLLGIHGAAQGSPASPSRRPHSQPPPPEPSRISPLAPPTRQTFPLAEQMGVEFPGGSLHK